jgi:uncharacterized protein HemX
MDPLEPIERTESTNMERPTPQVTSVPRKSKAPKVLGLLLVLALVACGALGWMSYDQSNQKSSLEVKVEDKDKEITQLQSQLKAVKTAPTEEDKAVVSDSEKIISAANNFAKTPASWGKLTAKSEITKQANNFASVQLSYDNAGGLTLVLKKISSEWVVVASGNNGAGDIVPTETAVNLFGIPQEIVTAAKK